MRLQAWGVDMDGRYMMAVAGDMIMRSSENTNGEVRDMQNVR